MSMFFVSMLLFPAMFKIPFMTPVKAHPSEIVVPDDYEKIQWAIDNASDGDTIFVKAGTYYENLLVNKALSIVGENKHNTIIDGRGSRTVVWVLVDNVKVSGFTIKKSQSIWPHGGIRLDRSSGVNISHNIITDNCGGINLFVSSNNILSSNTIFNNEDGIYFWHSSNNTLTDNNISNNHLSGIHLDSSSNNTLTSNNISNNHLSGIRLESSINNTLIGNNILNNDYGIYLYTSSNNVVSGNTASNNPHDGIRLESSGNNTLIGNNVFGNEDGIYLWYSSNNTLMGNNASNNGHNFGVFGNVFSHFSNYVGTSNQADERSVYYLIGVAEAVIDAKSNAGTIYLINCNNVTIRDSTLTKNAYGVFFWNTTNSNVEGITASNNDYGIYLWCSSNNTIVHNNFIDNTNQVYVTAGYANTWDCGYPSGGNYWSDYAGVDSDGNGIGDTSYPIDKNNQDNYPLMGAFLQFNIEIENKSHGIDVVCNSTISNFQCPHDNKTNSVGFKVITEGNGFCRICIPHALIEPPYTVTVNHSQPLDFKTVYMNGTHTWLYFTYGPQEHEITIMHTSPSKQLLWPQWAIFGLTITAVIVFSISINYYRLFRKQKKIIEVYEREVGSFPVSHEERARVCLMKDVIEREEKIQRFEKKYGIRIQPARTLEDLMEKLGVQKES